MGLGRRLQFDALVMAKAACSTVAVAAMFKMYCDGLAFFYQSRPHSAVSLIVSSAISILSLSFALKIHEAMLAKSNREYSKKVAFFPYATSRMALASITGSVLTIAALYFIHIAASPGSAFRVVKPLMLRMVLGALAIQSVCSLSSQKEPEVVALNGAMMA